jgi:hypothetical protein
MGAGQKSAPPLGTLLLSYRFLKSFTAIIFQKLLNCIMGKLCYTDVASFFSLAP